MKGRPGGGCCGKCSRRDNMARTIHAIASYLLIALGAVHTALTPVFYARLTPNAMWFAGAGLAMVFAGFLNVTLSRGRGGIPWRGGSCTLPTSWSSLPEP